MSPAVVQSVLLFVGSQGAWFACVLGAAYGWPWLGVLATALWIGVWAARRERPRADLAFLAIVGAVGWVVDSALVLYGAFGFPEAARLGGPSPLWMVALWIGFGTTLRALAPLLAMPLVAVAVGALAGPLAYNGGVAFGAARFGEDAWASRLVIAAAWAAALPLLVAVERRVR